MGNAFVRAVNLLDVWLSCIYRITVLQTKNFCTYNNEISCQKLFLTYKEFNVNALQIANNITNARLPKLLEYKYT